MKSLKKILLLLPLPLFISACQHNTESKESHKVLKPIQKINDTLYYTFSDNHIVINGIIENRIKARLIYDTGAGGNLYLDSAFTIKNNWFKPKSEALKDTLKKISWAKYAYEKSLFGKKKLHLRLGEKQDSLAFTSVMNLHKVIKGKADGIIGNNFMSQFVVEIDYQKKYIVLHDHQKFIKLNYEYASIPITYRKDTKLITIDLIFQLANGKQFTRTCLFDIGVGRNQIVLANNRIIEQFDLLRQLQNKVTEVKDFTTMHTNYQETYVGQLKSIKIGNDIVIDTPKVRLLYDKSPGKKFANLNTLVGNYIFKKFGKIIIDYQSNKIYLPKNKP